MNTQDRWQVVHIALDNPPVDKRMWAYDDKAKKWVNDYLSKFSHNEIPQRFLVIDTEAEIKEGEWILDTDYQSVEKAVRTPETKQDPNYILCSKIIASYPHIQNTIPLSIEFVTEYCKSGEGSRVKVETSSGWVVGKEDTFGYDEERYKENPDRALAISMVKEESKTHPKSSFGHFLDGMERDTPAIDNAGKEDEDQLIILAPFMSNLQDKSFPPNTTITMVINGKHWIVKSNGVKPIVEEVYSANTPATSPVDVEQMAKEYADKNEYHYNNIRHSMIDAVIYGSTLANPNKYSEEDMKRDSVGFAEWTQSGKNNHFLRSDKMWVPYINVSNSAPITTDQLYTIYKNENK